MRLSVLYDCSELVMSTKIDYYQSAVRSRLSLLHISKVDMMCTDIVADAYVPW